MLRIAKIAPSNTFKKMYRRLPKHIKEDFSDFAKELLSGDVPKGRMLKKRKGTKGVYEARLSSDYRVTFSLEGNIAKLSPYFKRSSINKYDLLKPAVGGFVSA